MNKIGKPFTLFNPPTVVDTFVPTIENRDSSYQSERELEKELIDQLKTQGYEYLNITNEKALIDNLRRQLEALNEITFSDKEWDNFFKNVIANKNDDIIQKTNRIQRERVLLLKRDDNSSKNINLIDKEQLDRNILQVINQYEVPQEKDKGVRYGNRYDVTILVNGLPMVHMELKSRGQELRQAFSQINRYQSQSFGASNGLFKYVQLFVISNGTATKYYSNTVRSAHVSGQNGNRNQQQPANSFSFTCEWADANNRPISDLTDFTSTFFAKHTLLNILTRYCIFDIDDKLLVMRPYQIVAAERILERIVTSTASGKLGTIDAGGYIWHTTGSGKTLTSFKTAQLADKLTGIEKVLFVVDRKDLDYQTMREYDKFEKGAANSSSSTKILKKHLEDTSKRIIITTIQKLSRFVNANSEHEVYDKHVVIIFDECHRSQFGEMHTSITKVFKRYHLFGFTGTPIFAANAASNGNPNRRTTEHAFGDKLHTYTIVNAINDKNVLPFSMDYVNTIKSRPDIEDKKVVAIDTQEVLQAPERIRQIVEYIREHFDQKTKRDRTAKHSGYNSLFATDSIESAKLYYREFANQQEGIDEKERIKVGIIYSYAPNEEEVEGLLGEEEMETEHLPASSREFLEGAIQDYNAMFKTSYDTSSEMFQNYYRDLSERLKKREIDLVIVVNMFLTGFDAKTLNTLWVDKNLRAHGLLQAFSRTNRILNDHKVFGTIVTFRNLAKETNKALGIFGDKDASGVVLMKPFLEVFERYRERAQELQDNYPLGCPIHGPLAQKAFIQLFGEIIRCQNILTSYDDFKREEILKPRDFQDYRSIYKDLYDEFRRKSETEKESILDDVVFEVELIKTVDIDADYIVNIVKARIKAKKVRNYKKLRKEIEKVLDASPILRDKKELILQFIDHLSATDESEDSEVERDVDKQWNDFFNAEMNEKLDIIIEEEKLNSKETKAFMYNAFRDGVLSDAGTEITKIFPPVSRFTKNNEHAIKKQVVLKKLSELYFLFYDLINWEGAVWN